MNDQSGSGLSRAAVWIADHLPHTPRWLEIAVLGSIAAGAAFVSLYHVGPFVDPLLWGFIVGFLYHYVIDTITEAVR